MDISESFKTWWRKYDDVEKCRLIKDKSIEVNNKHKKMIKASNAEFNYTGCRTGIRGGKKTTLSAKAQVSTRIYLDSLDELKFMVNTI
jgi:hypothetical protein